MPETSALRRGSVVMDHGGTVGDIGAVYLVRGEITYFWDPPQDDWEIDDGDPDGPMVNFAHRRELTRLQY